MHRGEKMQYLSIGQLAKKAQVKAETIRYYERLGLTPEPLRRDSGYRQYPKEIVARIQFIKRAKELGFSLREIDELLSLRLDPKTPCYEVNIRTKAKLSDISYSSR